MAGFIVTTQTLVTICAKRVSVGLKGAMVGGYVSPFRNRFQSGLIAAEITIGPSKVRQDPKQRRLRLKRSRFPVVGEGLLPVRSGVVDRARLIVGQRPIRPDTAGLM